MNRLSFACAALALTCATFGCARGNMSVSAPGKIARALEVVGDLEAEATLVPKGKSALKPVKLERGDDGVTFSGFIAADPGTYTLAIEFTGVPTGGERHFLGRLLSDSFTVSKGDTASPEFNQPVDVLGGDGDHGDDDNDGLGFLDELLLGTDPAATDSDSDGVEDGQDCAPTIVGDAFVIVDGGSIEDCDGDTHRGVNAPFGDPGTDCDDEDADVHPGVEDDCGTVKDTDCNPSTCPVDDSEGPTLSVETPVDEQVLGCQTPIVVHASDPSTVTNVNATLTDSPLSGGNPRRLFGNEDPDEEGRWLIANPANLTEITNLGLQPLVISAQDGAGNTSSVTVQVSYTLDFPQLTMTGATVLASDAVDLTIAQSSGRTLTQLELRRSAYNPQNTTVDGNEFEVLAVLDPSGGTVNFDPSDLETEDFVVYPFAADDIGNMAAITSSSFNSTNRTLSANFFCDGLFTYTVPAVRHVAADGQHPRMTALEKLDEVLAIADAQFPPEFELAKVIAFGMQADGTVDLAAPGYFFVSYAFLDPALPDNGGKSVDWFSADYVGMNNPVVNQADGSIAGTPTLLNTGTMVDSDTALDAYDATGCPAPFTGNSSDYVMYIQSGAATWIYVSPNNGELYGIDAHTQAEVFSCN